MLYVVLLMSCYSPYTPTHLTQRLKVLLHNIIPESGGVPYHTFAMTGYHKTRSYKIISLPRSPCSGGGGGGVLSSFVWPPCAADPITVPTSRLPVPSDPMFLLPSFIPDRLHALTSHILSSSTVGAFPPPLPHHTHLKSPFLPPTVSYLHYASGLLPSFPPSSLLFIL